MQLRQQQVGLLQVSGVRSEDPVGGTQNPRTFASIGARGAEKVLASTWEEEGLGLEVKSSIQSLDTE